MSEAFYPLDNTNFKTTLYGFYEECIYFFSMDAVVEMVSRHEKATDDYYNCLYHDIIHMCESDLVKKIKNQHTEYVLPFITVFLWKQRLGLISNELRLEVDMEPISSLFGDYVVRRIHRMMSLTGYNDIYMRQPPNQELKGIYNSYVEVIDDLLGFHTKKGYCDDDYFSWLLDFLCIMGSANIKKYYRYNEVISLTEYILTNIDKDERIGWINIEVLIFFLYTLRYNNDLALDSFKKMLNRADHVTILTEVLAIKLFGTKTFGLFKKRDDHYSYFGGCKNFYKLVLMQ